MNRLGTFSWERFHRPNKELSRRPRQVLNPGPHTLYITASTNDPLYHFDAWYQFALTFVLAP